MKRAKTLRVAVILMLLSAAATPLLAKRSFTIEDTLNVKSVTGPLLSPNGQWVLYGVRGWETPKPDQHNQRGHLWLVSAMNPTGDGAPRQITFGEKGESSPQWSPDGKYISFIASRGDDAAKAQIYLMRVDGGEAWPLTSAKESVGSYTWSDDGRRIAYAMLDSLPKDVADRLKHKDDPEVFEEELQKTHLWVIDLASKQATQITSGSDLTMKGAPVWSPDGTRIAFVAAPTAMTRDERGRIFLVTVATKKVEPLTSNQGAEDRPAWSPDSSTIAYSFQADSGKPNGEGFTPFVVGQKHLMLYNVASRQSKDVSNSAFDYDVPGGTWTPDGKRLILAIGHRAYHDIFAYEPATNRYVELTDKTMTAFGNYSHDGQRVVFTRESGTESGEAYVADANFKSPRKLTDTNPQVRDWAMGDVEVVSWKSDDGLPVEGVLIKPANYQPGKRYPLLVGIHGGPAGAHVTAFHPDMQYWASEGWAVLLPNPRGSTNYGEKFLRANIADWGGGDFRDIMTGVDAMVQRGIADPDKMAEMGWSYGGFMTAWVVTHTNRFKAAMMGAGLADLFSMYGTTDVPSFLGTYLKGPPGPDTLPLYLERSSLMYVDKVTTPLLILQGGADRRVPTSQSMEFYRALKDRGKTTELVYYPREGHGLTEWYHSLDRARRQSAWIKKYTLGVTADSKPQEATAVAEPK